MMLRLVLTLYLLTLVSACSNATNPPVVVEKNVAITSSEMLTPSFKSVPGKYEEALQHFDYDMQSSLVITENLVQQENGYTLRDIHYPSPKGGTVPSYLLVPNGTGPFAGLVLMHGSSGSRESLLPFARDLVLTGAVVLTISGPAARSLGRDWIHFT